MKARYAAPLRLRPTAIALALAASFAAPHALASTVRGAPVGGAFPVLLFGLAPSVASDAAGDFVVAYVKSAGNFTIHAQRYNSSGVSQGGDFLVNAPGADGAAPAVAMDATGNFVVTWYSYGGGVRDIYARRYSANGTPLDATPILVNTSTSNNQLNPAVAMDADGDFVVAWQSHYGEAPGDYAGIYAQRFSSAGVAQGGEFVINSITAGSQDSPVVARAATGGFVVAWRSPDGSGSGIWARRFNPNGTPKDAADFLVNTSTTSEQADPSIAMDATGDFTVAWEATYQAGPGGNDIFAQRFTAAGAKQGGDILVNSTLTSGSQINPAVALDADSDFIVAWQGYGPSGTNADAGVYAQRYNNAPAVDLALTKTDSPDPAQVGNPLAYTLTVTNNRAPSAPTGIAAIDAAIGSANTIRVTDTLPAGVSFVPSAPGAWTCSENPPGTVICDDTQTLLAGTNSAATVTVTPGAEGNITNNATVDAAQFDAAATQANNADSEGTTIIADTTPNQFTFTDYGTAACSEIYISSYVTLTGFSAAAPISITGGSYEIESNGFTSNPGMVNPGQKVRLQVQSKCPVNAHADAKLTAGGVFDTWTVTTVVDTTPKPYFFVDIVDAVQGVGYSSGEPTRITGLNTPVTVSIAHKSRSCPTCTGTYQLNDEPPTDQPKTLKNGDTLLAIVTAANKPNTVRRARFTVGGVTREWKVTTAP
jgi:hypothetical protein